MWSRKALKEEAKLAFRRNYWRCVCVGALISILLGAVAFVVALVSGFWSSTIGLLGTVVSGVSRLPAGQFLVWFVSYLVFMAVFSVFLVFVFDPLSVSSCRFYIRNSEEYAGLDETLYPFSSGARYIKIVCGQLLAGLIASLFALLLIVPGIIKMYDYYLVGYILADDPNMRPADALRKSKAMMRGQRWKTFVMNLSFLPWHILNELTLGIVGIFYVSPYIAQTKANLYLTLKEYD